MAAFAAFGSGIESQIAGIAESTSTSLISSIYPIIVIALTIYFIARAWSIMLGSRDSLGGLILTCVKIGFIAWIGLSSGRFIAYAIGGVSGLENLLLSALPNATASSWAAIDGLWESTAKGVAALWELIGTFGVTRFGEEMLLAVSVITMTILGVLLTSAALGVILTAKVSLVLILGFGPIFVCSLMFKATSGFFHSWLHAVLSTVMTLVLAGAVILLFTGVFSDRIDRISELASASGDSDTFGVWIQLGITLVVTLTASSIVRLTPSLAAGIVGGHSMQAAGLGQMVAGVMQPTVTAVGGTMAGFAWGSGNSKSKAGRALLGHYGLREPGAFTMAAGGAAIGAAFRGGKAVSARLHRTIDAADAQAKRTE